MRALPHWKGLVLLLTGVACLAGCKKAATLQSNAFQSAAPEAKASWNTVVAAMKTNGYVVALTELQGLRLRTDLTPEQDATVEQTSRKLTDELYKAVEKGDAKAKQDMDALQARSRR